MSETAFPQKQSAPEFDVAASTALEAIERASIDIQIATAKRYPRTLSTVKADMLSFATLDEETASSCFYTLPRGGKTIQGPSVRLAEIALACYGNLRAGSRVISVVTDGPEPHVVIQAVAHDLQRNVAISIEKRRRITKKKSKDRVDEDDINLAANAGSAIAFRDAVFKVVPLALIKPVYEQAKLVAVGDVKSIAKKRQQVLDRLKQMGVTEDRILAVAEVAKAEDIGQAQLETLIGLGTAIKDGDTTLEEAFPAVSKKPVFTDPASDANTPPDMKPVETSATAPNHLKGLRGLLKQDGVTEGQLLKFLRTQGMDESIDDLGLVPTQTLKIAFDTWADVVKAIKGSEVAK